MKISIVTVCYNSVETLKETICSIRSQDYDNIEFIIIDGDSKDGTLNLIIENSNVIDKWISEKDNGLYDAMNKGISIASGEIIGILNSDDLYFTTNTISLVMNEFIQDCNLDLIYGDLIYVKRDNINKVIRTWKSSPYNDNFFRNGNVPPHPTLFLRKHVYERIGLFDTKFKLAADYDFIFRVFNINKFNSKYLNEFLVRMRLGGESNKNLVNILKQNIEVFKVWRKYNRKMPLFFFPIKFLKRLGQFIYSIN